MSALDTFLAIIVAWAWLWPDDAGKWAADIANAYRGRVSP